MRHNMRNAQYVVFGLLLTATLSGCNLFSNMHSDGKESNSHVLVADGNAAMQRGDYAKAAEYYRLAIEHNPRDSEARVGYAQAYIKAPDPNDASKGFSLGAFTNSLMSAMKNDSGNNSNIEFIDPSAWGVDTLAEVDAMLQTLIAVLDPIALGQTDGPYAPTDVDVNLTAGLFYILRVAIQMQGLSGNFAVEMISKSDVPTSGPADWGLSAATLNNLSDDFLWIVDSSGPELVQPSVGFITSLQTNVQNGLDRLRVAAAHSSSADLLSDIIDMFDDWEGLAFQ